MTERQFMVEGMTCSGCERTLETVVSRLKGVHEVRADRKRGRLRVCYEQPCTETAITGAVEQAGYHVTEEPRRSADGVCLLVILLGLFVIARQLGWTQVFQRFPTVSGERVGYAALFLIGLLTAFEVADIFETSVCPLARVMRQELRKRGIRHLKVVYSREPALTPIEDLSISCRAHCICPPGTARKCTQRRQVPGSNAFVPSVAGLIIAGEVVKDLTQFANRT